MPAPPAMRGGSRGVPAAPAFPPRGEEKPRPTGTRAPPVRGPGGSRGGPDVPAPPPGGPSGGLQREKPRAPPPGGRPAAGAQALDAVACRGVFTFPATRGRERPHPGADPRRVRKRLPRWPAGASSPSPQREAALRAPPPGPGAEQRPAGASTFPAARQVQPDGGGTAATPLQDRRRTYSDQAHPALAASPFPAVPRPAASSFPAAPRAGGLIFPRCAQCQRPHPA